MTFEWLVSFSVRGTCVLALCALCLAVMVRRSAAERRLVLLLSLTVCGLLPFALLLPQGSFVNLQIPAEVLAIATDVATDPGSAQPLREAAPASHAPKTSPWPSITTLALCVWALGASFAGLRLVLAQARAARIVKRAVADVAGRLLSSEVSSPVTVGLWRPIVVLPSSATTWSTELLSSVQLHEAAHVRRRDGLVLFLGQLCCALHWFQPLAWWALGRLRRECELGADESVLAAGLRPSTYAEHLLSVARGFVATPGAVTMAARPSELSRRITAVLRHVAPPRPLSRLAIVLGAALSLGVLQAAAGANVVPSGRSAARADAPSDSRMHAIVKAEAERLHAEFKVDRVALAVLSARDAKLLAYFDDRPSAAVVPASTLKPLVVASALEARELDVSEQIDCGPGQRVYPTGTLRDWQAFGVLPVTDVIARSSNVGAARIFERLGLKGLQAGLARFGLTLPSASISGLDDASLSAAVTGIGQRGIAVTPVELARAYSVFAAQGRYHGADGSQRQALSKATSDQVLAILEAAVNSEHGTGRGARIEGVRVAGKTGTSDGQEAFASFVGIVPADAPRFVIYVGLGTREGDLTGAKQAAPAFARIAASAISLPQ